MPPNFPHPLPAPHLEQGRRAALHYSLSQAPIFAGLPDIDLVRLTGYCRIEPLPRGEYLFRVGDPVRGFFLVRTGSLTVHRYTAEGRQQVIHLLRAGDSFAERAVISESGYPANARAVVDSEVILIPIDAFKLHQKERPDLAWRMLSSMSHHLRTLVATLEGLRFTDVESRLIHWLLQRCPASVLEALEEGRTLDAVTIELPMTQNALAQELAARRETLSRALRKLQGEGHLTVQRSQITLHSPVALQQLLLEKQTAKGATE